MTVSHLQCPYSEYVCIKYPFSGHATLWFSSISPCCILFLVDFLTDLVVAAACQLLMRLGMLLSTVLKSWFSLCCRNITTRCFLGLALLLNALSRVAAIAVASALA